MCIFGGSKPSYTAPNPTPLAPAAPPPPPPAQPIVHEPPQSVQQQDTQIKAKQSRRAQQGSLSKGASQLRIPLNTGGSSGGLNL